MAESSASILLVEDDTVYLTFQFKLGLRWRSSCSPRRLEARSAPCPKPSERPRGDYASLTDMPPSTIIGLPVMKLDRSDNKKRAACAISSALAIRFIGWRLAM